MQLCKSRSSALLPEDSFEAGLWISVAIKPFCTNSGQVSGLVSSLCLQHSAVCDGRAGREGRGSPWRLSRRINTLYYKIQEHLNLIKAVWFWIFGFPQQEETLAILLTFERANSPPRAVCRFYFTSAVLLYLHLIPFEAEPSARGGRLSAGAVGRTSTGIDYWSWLLIIDWWLIIDYWLCCNTLVAPSVNEKPQTVNFCLSQMHPWALCSTSVSPEAPTIHWMATGASQFPFQLSHPAKGMWNVLWLGEWHYLSTQAASNGHKWLLCSAGSGFGISFLSSRMI